MSVKIHITLSSNAKAWHILYDHYCTMRSLEICLYRICLLVCLCSTGYMTYLQFKYYLDNDDVASISYQHFNQEEKDKYPTVTLCISDQNNNGKIFNETNTVFDLNVTTPSLYEHFLWGSVKNRTFDLSTIQYDDVILNVHDGYLRGAVSGTSFFTFSGYQNYYPVPFNEAFYRGPNTLCFEKKVKASHKKNARQYWDGIYLNSTLCLLKLNVKELSK